MSKIKDLSNDVKIMERVMATMQTAQGTISADLYAAIKEVAEMKYRNVELEARLTNLEHMVKTIHEKGG